MTTLYQRSDEELKRLLDRLTSGAESNGNSFEAVVAEAAGVIEKEGRFGSGPVPPHTGSGAQLVAMARSMVTEELVQRVDDRKLAALLQRKIDAENRKPAKERAPIVSPYHASTWPGDAKIWMEVAVGLDRGSRGTNSNIHDHNKSNVAHVATGFAFELTYKSLLVGEFEPFLQKHSCLSLHQRLASDTKTRLEAIMVKQGWSTATECVTYLDQRMSNADRKYWMVNPDRTRRTRQSEGTGFIVADGPMAIARLGKVLFTLLPMATSKLSRARRAWDYLHRQPARPSL